MSKESRFSLLFAAMLLVGRALGGVPGAAPPYAADRTDPRIIRVWGDPGAKALFQLWEAGYSRIHPEIAFENNWMSTAMAMPGIYLGIADLAVLGREPNVQDHDGFAHVRAYPPLRLELATGSVATVGKSPALAVFVHKSNPLARLTLGQLNGLFGCEPTRGIENLRTWGDLGLHGAWADRPVHLYAWDIETGSGQYFLHAVLAASRKLNWESLREFRGSRAALDALSSDPFGLAVADQSAVPPGEAPSGVRSVRPVALATASGARYFLPTRQSVESRSYPLTRVLLGFVNRPPGGPINPKTRGFLEYIYSAAGQQDVRAEGAFLPLTSENVRDQARELK